MSDERPKPSEQMVGRKDDLERDPAKGDVENDAGLGDGADTETGRTNV